MQTLTDLGFIFSQNRFLLLTLTAIIGLLIGSFLNVVILRQPKRMFHEWRQQCQQLLASEETTSTDTPVSECEPPPGIVKQRSFCPDCQHQLSALDNIPLFSYLFLKGRCRYCKEKISYRYPLVEFITAVVSIVVVWHFGWSVEALVGLIISWALIVLSGIDIDHQLLPDTITLPLLWLGLLLSLTGITVSPAEAIIGAATGYLILWSMFQLFRLVTGKEGMGYGDFKLLAVLGAWLGWQMLPLIVLLSSLVGAIIGGTLLAVRKQGSQPIPFGPYLAIAGWVAMIWGSGLTDFYLNFMGL